MSQKIGFRSLSIFFVFAFVLALCSNALFAGEAQARESSSVYVGEAIADTGGDVFVISSSGERLKMDSSPMPIFEGSLIDAKKGSMVISLTPDGIVEVMKGSEVKIGKFGKRIFISLNSGAIRFSVPSKDMLTIAIPSEGISITMASYLASTSDKIIIEGSARAGSVELREDGTAIVSSFKGPLEVSTVEGKTMVLAEGKSMILAQAGDTGTKAKTVLTTIKKSSDLLVLGVTLGMATGVAIISQNTDSGGAFVASGP